MTGNLTPDEATVEYVIGMLRSELKSDPPKVEITTPSDHTCRKHGNIGGNYFSITTAADAGHGPIETRYCTHCFHDMVKERCERAIPVGVPPGPFTLET